MWEGAGVNRVCSGVTLRPCPFSQAPDADPTLSDWDRFAAAEYDFLLAEEAQDDDAWEEG